MPLGMVSRVGVGMGVHGSSVAMHLICGGIGLFIVTIANLLVNLLRKNSENQLAKGKSMVSCFFYFKFTIYRLL